MGDVGEVERNGRRLAWTAVGDGPPLLLLQGYGGTAADWDPTFLGALAARFRVVCPDPRGMGSSTLGDLDEAFTVEGMADDAVAVLDALGLDRVAVVGWSMGGFVAQALTCRAPARVRSLALLGTDPGGPDSILAEPEVWARLVDDSGTPREQATRLLHLLFPDPLATAFDAQVGDLVAAARAAIDPATLRAQEQAIAAWHAATPPPVPSSPPPVVAVAGAEDVVIPPADLAVLAERWPGSEAHEVAGAGHAVMAQAAERVAALVVTGAA